jgi:hypothetical protein
MAQTTRTPAPIPAVAVLLAGLLAGCAGGERPDDTADPTPGEPTAMSFAPPVVALEECLYSNCYEPSVAADPQGRLFVVDGSTSAVAVSEDGGLTWDQRAPPPLPIAVEGNQGDVLVQVAPSGRLYWSALVIANPMGAFVLEGIQVAWSDDGAKTWLGDVHVSPATGTPQVLSPDRQWLGFAPDGTIYLTYNQLPTGIWIARSDDDGTTWSGWTRAASFEGRSAGLGQSGPPVVGSDGTVFVPACEGLASTEAASRTMVFRSVDRGATFTPTTVDIGCNWFPIATVAPDGTLIVAGQPDGVQVAWSRDGGRTFEGPQRWGQGTATAGVWPLMRADGRVFVAWFAEGSASSDLHVARGTLADGPVEDVVAGTATGEGTSRTSARTDFASAALLPDGRLAVVWVEGNQVVLAVTAFG